MKKRFALLAIVALGTLTVLAIKNQKKKTQMTDFEPFNEDKLKLELPELPQESSLSSVLLESYRVQCQVMMDGYPSQMNLDIHHHFECETKEQKAQLIPCLSELGYTVLPAESDLSVLISKRIPTSSQSAFNAVVEVAECAQTHAVKYQGWIFENCR